MHGSKLADGACCACVRPPQVLQFVLEAVRAESFNPATLFLFGSYTIGKERLFLEVARILQRKAGCAGLPPPLHAAAGLSWMCRGEPLL